MTALSRNERTSRARDAPRLAPVVGRVFFVFMVKLDFRDEFFAECLSGLDEAVELFQHAPAKLENFF